MTYAPIAPVIESGPWPTPVLAEVVEPEPALVGLINDRLRIAGGVNDVIIRHLFSIGLSLHSTRTMVSDEARDRIDTAIEELDASIGELRSLIFELGDRADTESRRAKTQML